VVIPSFTFQRPQVKFGLDGVFMEQILRGVVEVTMRAVDFIEHKVEL
jgi:hypothetical protein